MSLHFPQKLILDRGMLKPFHLFRRVQGIRRNYATELNVNDYEYLAGKYDLKGRKTVVEQLQPINRYQPNFYMRIPHTTRDFPNIIYAQFGEDKVVGCLCEKDVMHANYWILKNDGKARRCECGEWFKISDAEPDTI